MSGDDVGGPRAGIEGVPDGLVEGGGRGEDDDRIFFLETWHVVYVVERK